MGSRVFAVAGDHLDNSSTPPVTAPPFTISAWVKTPTLGTNYVFVTFGTSASASQRFSILVNTTGNASITEFDTTTSQAVSTTAIADANWHMITGVWADHTNRAAYLDGGGKGTISALKAATASNVTRLSGTPTGTFPAVGSLCYVGVWGVALSDAEVALLQQYAPPFVRNDALLAYWPMTGASPEPDNKGSWPLTITGTTYSNDASFLILAGPPLLGGICT